jgi:hypothetical protein
MGEEEKGAHLAEDRDDAAGCAVSDGGEAEKLRVSGGVRRGLVGVGEGVELLEGRQGWRGGASSAPPSLVYGWTP